MLVGTLLRAGDQLRATAQLVEAPGGTLLSSQAVQAPLGDVFGLQDELARRLVESLSPSLATSDGRPRRATPASAHAYELYLRANEAVRDWSQIGAARDLYRRCVEEDPAFAPATGTPEVGGLSTWQAQAIIRRLAGLRFVGMDVVEVAPAYDHAEITALAAATMVWEYLALMAASGRLPAIDADAVIGE